MHWGWFGFGVVVTLVIVNFPKLYTLVVGMFGKKAA